MDSFFKKIAFFSAFCSMLFAEDESVVKVEVATIIWEKIQGDETFEIAERFQLVEEALILEEYSKPKINLEVIEEENTITFDFNFLEIIPEIISTQASDEETEQEIALPSFYRILDTSEHELNGTMRRISAVEGLTLNNHKSWYQPLGVETKMPFILVSKDENQCVVKVFQSRYPRIHAKCAMGPDALKRVSLINKSEYTIRDLLGENFDRSRSVQFEEDESEAKELYLLDEQRRISLDEFHYFDHPKIGILVGVYKFPKEED